MKRCVKCFLPETYPGVQFDENGICNYCIFFDIYQTRQQVIKSRLEKEVINIIDEAKKSKKGYDCLVCYSGGKDSTFLLYNLKDKFGLKILAYTLDNGFLSHTAIENINKILESLDVDHIIFKPRQRILKKIFVNVLTKKTPYPKELVAMMSPICATCQGIVLGTAAKLAIDKDIPLVFVGFTPGQYPDISFENFLKVKSCIYFTSVIHKDDPPDMIRIIRDPIDELCGEEIKNYYFKSQYLVEGDKAPRIIFPYQIIFKYDEKEIYKKIKELGWERPVDTDACSTNCLLNTLGNYACMKQFKFHPYIGEMSFLIRSGLLSYKEAIESEQIDESSYAIKYSLEKLGLSKEDIVG